MKTMSAETRPKQMGEPLKAINALELLGSAKTIVIEHQGARYELRLTRNGKLILTK